MGRGDTGYKGRQTRLDKRKARNSTLGNMTDQLHHCKRVLRAVTRQPRTVCALSLAAQRHIRQLVSRTDLEEPGPPASGVTAAETSWAT